MTTPTPVTIGVEPTIVATTTVSIPPASPKGLKILLIGPTIFKLPLQGYGGTEAIMLSLAEEFNKAGHQVTVVAPEGSVLPEGVTLFPVPLRCSEEEAFSKYRALLGVGVAEPDPSWDIIHDHSFGSWVYLESVGVAPALPIVKTHHTDPSIWASPPPVPHPCLVGISTDHAHRLSLAYGVATRRVYNGINLQMYSPPPEGSKRNGRLLWLGRYTPEKDPLSAMQLAKRLRIPLDCYGDTEIVGDPGYIDRCRAEADGLIVRWYPGVSREKTVELYRTYRALLYTPNWLEPFGLVICEAMACGMPVLTLDRGSMRELVLDGVSGYVCGDISGLEKVLKEGCLASIKAEDCVKTAARFSKEIMAQEYLNLFAQVRAGNSW
jgi:glycosyltransferase involved in cell wall biosynthesis